MGGANCAGGAGGSPGPATDPPGGTGGDPADLDPTGGDPADGEPARGDPADGDPADGTDGDPPTGTGPFNVSVGFSSGRSGTADRS